MNIDGQLQDSIENTVRMVAYGHYQMTSAYNLYLEPEKPG